MTQAQPLTPVQQAQLDLDNKMTKRTNTTPLYQQNQQAYIQTYGSSNPEAIKTSAQTIPQSVWTDRLNTTGQHAEIANQSAAASNATVKQAKADADYKRWQDQVAATQKSIGDSFAAFQKSMLTKYPVAKTTYTNYGGGWVGADGKPVDAHTAAVINNNIRHGLNADGTPKITQYGNDGVPAPEGQLIFQDPKDAQIASWARQAGWAESDIPMVIRIAQAESSRSNTASHVNGNGSTDYGLMQINTIHRNDGGAINSNFFTGGGWKDPVQNLRAALQIKNQSGGGWGPWSTFTSGAYKGYNPDYHVASASLNASTGYVGGNISAGTTGLRAQVVSKGMQYLGTPYVWGGNSLTNGVDCSGLVHSLYQQFGISTPRTANQDAHPDQWGSGYVKGYNYDVIKSKTQLDHMLMPGDLITFKGTGSVTEYGHVAIYIGDGRILESPDVGLTVRVRDLRPSEYSRGNMRAIHLELAGDHPPGWNAISGAPRTNAPNPKTGAKAGGGPRAV